MNILFVSHNKKEIHHAYISNYNYKCKNQVILLMIIDDDERWLYLTIRSLSALLRRISSSTNGDFYCLNCFHLYLTLNKLKRHDRVCNNHDWKKVKVALEIQLWRKIGKSSIYNLCRFRMFAKKGVVLSKKP